MNRSLVVLSLLVTLALPGCSSSPTEIVGGPLVFEGTLAADELAVFTVVITRSGGVRIEVTSVVADPPLGEGIDPSLGVGIGELDAEGNCVVTVSSRLTTGGSLAVGLSEQEYCLRVFDDGSIGEDGTRIFSILVAPSE